MNKQQYWDVYTGSSGNEHSGDDVFLGTYHGYVDDIALRLANKQSGFWCAGYLTFKKTRDPKKQLPTKIHDRVNVVVHENDWVGEKNFKKARKFFANRPVRVEECNLYGAVTIVRGRKP